MARSEEKFDYLEKDRGAPMVSEKDAGSRDRLKKMIFLLSGIGAAIFFILWIYFRLVASDAPTERAREKNLGVNEAGLEKDFGRLPTPASEVPAAAVPAPVVPAVPAPFVIPNETASASVDHSSFAMMYGGSGKSAKSSSGQTGEIRAGGHGGEGALSGLLNGTATNMENARMLPSRNFLLTKGNMIECALQTRLDSTVAGMVACSLTGNVYSTNGKVLLMERGSRLVGEYRANIRQGQERIFVLWTRVETPTGVVVNLDSPGTDALGGSGVPGHVDTHFWKRFGGAILLSMLDTGLDIVKERASRSNDINLDTGSNSDDYSEIATEALRNSINIPPTLYVLNGDRLNVFVARDLDFSDVYKLEAKD